MAANSTAITQEVSDSKKLSQEIALQRVYEICQARIRYNKQLMNFCLTGSAEDIKQYFKIISGGMDSLLDSDFTTSKKEMVKRFVKDIKSYEEVAKRIDSETHTQEFIDRLYYSLNANLSSLSHFENEAAKLLNNNKNKATKTKKILAKLRTEHYHESAFIRECVSMLEPFISQTQIDFNNEFEFTYNHTAEDLVFEQRLRARKRNNKSNFFRLLACHPFSSSIGDSLKKIISQRELSISENILYRPVTYLLERWHEICNGLNDTIPFSWELYREVHDMHATLKRIAYSLEDIVQKPASSSIITTSIPQLPDIIGEDTLVEPSNSILESKAIHSITPNEVNEIASNNLLEEECQDEVSQEHSLASNIGQEKEASQIIPDNQLLPQKLNDLYQELSLTFDEKQEKEELEYIAIWREKNQEKIAERKLQVEQNRQAKRKLKIQSLPAMKRKEQANRIVEILNEEKQKAAFGLLSLVNNDNLTLLEQMLSKPTPHCKIRYQKIESLFGYGEGKLQGYISKNKGSHQKITIHGIVGYFDKIESQDDSLFENKSTSVNETGPLWRAHKPGHSGKLPSITITMICETLACVGITDESLQLFLRARSKANSEKEASVEQLLNIAKSIQQYERKLMFLMGTHHRAGKDSAIKMFAVHPNDSAELGNIKLNSKRYIFKFL